MNPLSSAIRSAMGGTPDRGPAIGVAWYRPEQWSRLREIAPDRDGLEDTFEEWHANATGALTEIQASGQHVECVDVDTEALLAWCNEQGTEPTSDNRAAFASELLRRKYGADE